MRWGFPLIGLVPVVLSLFVALSRMMAQGQEPTGTVEPEVFLPIMLKELTPTPSPSPQPEPVIRISGRVTKADGSGFADVEIYAGMFCYIGSQPDVFVAKTGADGYYEGTLACPFGHDETYHVNAVYPGRVFRTENPCWRDYGYCMSKTANFTEVNPGSKR